MRAKWKCPIFLIYLMINNFLKKKKKNKDKQNQNKYLQLTFIKFRVKNNRVIKSRINLIFQLVSSSQVSYMLPTGTEVSNCAGTDRRACKFNICLIIFNICGRPKVTPGADNIKVTCVTFHEKQLEYFKYHAAACYELSQVHRQ